MTGKWRKNLPHQIQLQKHSTPFHLITERDKKGLHIERILEKSGFLNNERRSSGMEKISNGGIFKHSLLLYDSFISAYF